MTGYLLLFNGLPEIRQSYREILDRAGYRTASALSIDDVIKSVGVTSPDVIIVEASGGLDAAIRHIESMRLHPKTTRIPLLLLLPEGVRPPASLKESATLAYLREPCSPRQLLDEIQYLTTPERSGVGYPDGGRVSRHPPEWHP